MGYEQPQAPTTSGISVAEVQNATYTYAADAEASDSYAITLSQAPSSYTEGQTFRFKANTANTGAASLDVNGLGAKTIKKLNDQDLADNDIESGSIVEVVYDGTNFQMVSVSAVSKVDAAASSTDNAIARFDGTGGDTIQNSGVTVDDSDNLSGVNNKTGADTNFVSGTAGTSGNVAEWDGNGDLIDSTVDVKAAVRTIVLSGAGGWVSTTSGATAAAQVEHTTNDVDTVAIEFTNSGSDEHAQWTVVMPDNYGGGTVTAIFYWYGAATTGSVVWGIQGIAYADDDAVDTAWGTRQQVTDGAGSANDDVMISSATSAVTLAGSPAGGQLVQFRVTRSSGDASDDFAASAFLLAVKVEYTTNAFSD